ncbi:MAG: DUF559 domain-containing protein [Nitrospinales bacterium]
MARQKNVKSKVKSSKKPIEQYGHEDKKRKNNPPVGLVTPATDKESGKKKYSYDPHLDPALQWAGKTEHTSFEVPTVSLHVHERMDPKTVMEAVKRRNGNDHGQMGLFESPEENPPLREALDFYKHAHNWSNRLIAGDSLLVMNSLLEKEGMAGQVQMVYIDPPYGIKYGSNFQPFVNKRDVKDGKDDDLNQEPEMIRAFRDTWELGIHSYLTYLRDRLLLARELLHESGSCFVQISDENVHLVRNLMDEVFGVKNFCSQIQFVKTSSATSNLIPTVMDYVLWYGKEKKHVKYRSLFIPKPRDAILENYKYVEKPNGTWCALTKKQLEGFEPIPNGKRFWMSDLTSQNPSPNRTTNYEYKDKCFHPGKDRHWSCSIEGLDRLKQLKRLVIRGEKRLCYKRYIEDFPYQGLSHLWEDTTVFRFNEGVRYVVMTSTKVIQRCLLMTTDPGDLVFDPTCGSGTTAYVAEQWGRRWITCDTSRVAVTLAKQRIMTALYDYYKLAHPDEGVGSGFVYKTVPHITLKSIANNEPPGRETLYDQPELDKSRARVTGPFTVEAVPAPMVKPLEEALTPTLSHGERGKGEGKKPLPADLLEFARKLRKEQTQAEQLLWALLRDRRLAGCKFRRQHPVDPYVLDFYCHEARLGIELDGGQHNEPKREADDRKRTAFFEQKGVHVLRFWNNEVFAQTEGVLQSIYDALTPTLSHGERGFDADESVARSGETQRHDEWRSELLKTGVRGKNGQMILFSRVEPLAGTRWLHADAETRPNDKGKDTVKEKDVIYGKPQRVVISYGPEHAPLEQKQVEMAWHEARALIPKPAIILFASFQFDPEAAKDIDELTEEKTGMIFLKVQMNTDLLTDDLKKRRSGNQSFWLIGQPDVELRRIGKGEDKGKFEVEVHGFDYYNTRTGAIESGDTGKIALWMLDMDYDERSLYPRQVFFPMSGEKDGWSRLAKNLRAEIDEELIEAYRGTVSLPFEPGKHGQVAVKIVDDRGIESLKILKVEA